MRTRVLFICLLVCVFCIFLLLRRGPSRAVAIPEPAQTPSAQEASPTRPSEVPAGGRQQPDLGQPATAATPLPPRQAVAEDTNAYMQALLAEWRAPIDFFGKVVDEKDQPVPGATIRFTWSEMPLFSGDGDSATTTSGLDGLFSLQGKHGPSLDVWVRKEGFYTSRANRIGFSYALGQEKFSPDPMNPVVFHLRKKGQGAQLITSQNGIRPTVAVRIPKDNTPVWVDLFAKRASQTGQLRIRQNKPPWREASEWSFELSIPDGGLVDDADEFPFQAPDGDYQPKVEYRFTNTEANWTTHVTEQVYFAVGHPQKYGWLRIESDLGQETIFLTYAINPSGSRNLEPAD